MPELPEVETVVRSLRPFIVGRCFQHLEIRHPKSFPNVSLLPRILNRPIKALKRRGKMIEISWSGDYVLLTHLKMTGQLLFKDRQQLAGGGHPSKNCTQLPNSHTRVIYTLDNQSQLFFNDMRLFGWQKILQRDQEQVMLQALGPDADDSKITPEYLQKAFAKTARAIKQVIMDNRIMVGIGNIYAAEILFAAGISPLLPAKQLNLLQIKKMLKCQRDILSRAIALRGTTFDGRYVDARGLGGNYESQLQVYGRCRQPCKHCGCLLINSKIGGRSTVWCRQCQR